ncbi:DUF262 domain-containing protein [Shewanella sp. 202IG2-18]|uniref:DUF262 domain-containing protein n=1 Tax=Parashewanella hymeniacidonis TaxID=2807618 RepID=UPI001960B181|nr:DUF262 domain-containing protein [Parashewanella hymeniacidonis]MBM7070664.1 DUF262 domain-containing protein [Parashewanella hymeniacidonis]
MTVSVASCTLAQLFQNDNIIDSDGIPISGKLTIPEYQRPYRWTEKQIQRLLSDYQDYLEVLRSKQSQYCYYLGSVILHQSPSDNCLNIIDGQQRLTTLALLSYFKLQLFGNGFEVDIQFHSPESQQQIQKNWLWIKEQAASFLEELDESNINLTLVVTQSEDDAYRFFETQNTGGVRLGGADIIKAHHLRAIERKYQNDFASKWEALGNLNPVISSLLKGRYWQALNRRELPSHRKPQQVRAAIVEELGEDTMNGDDVAYGRFYRVLQQDSSYLEQHTQNGYEMRQPLNTGINSIHYLSYFETLRVNYLTINSTLVSAEYEIFADFYQHLVCKLDGCSYLKGLYDTCLLLYISQFGEEQLIVAAKKIFRVVYSRRVSNQKAVRETSIPSFVNKHPVLDWITTSYTPEMCLEWFDKFELKVDPASLEKNSVKKRFIYKTIEWFNIELSEKCSATELAEKYRTSIDQAVIHNLHRNKVKED